MNASCHRCCLAILVFLSSFTSAPAAHAGGIAYEVIKSMQLDELVGSEPVTPVLEGSDGALYGTTRSARNTTGDTIFKVNKDGAHYRTLHSFGAAPHDGSLPSTGLVRGPDGRLYGATQSGGRSNLGTIFRIGDDGQDYEITFHFGAQIGITPRGAPLFGGDGGLYGTARHGGATDNGVLYAVSPDGGNFRVLHHFGSAPLDGKWPGAGLIKGSDGALYGTTEIGGTNEGGTVFRINEDGSGYAVLHRFANRADGHVPVASLLECNDGFLYGTTAFGGISDAGTIFRLARDGGQFEVLHRFDSSAGQGANPFSELIHGSDGALYGATRAPSVLFKFRVDTRSFEVLRSFATNGPNPPFGLLGGLRRASDGFLYGTSEEGGAYSDGTLFRIAESGANFAKLIDFGAPNVGGAAPRSGLIRASDGHFYGTTELGGLSNAGTIFALDAATNSSRVIKQLGQPGDGRIPNGLVEASDGLLYGTTQSGGAAGHGLLYCVAKNGSNYNVLWNFSVGILSTDGKQPWGSIVAAADGLLYGATAFGGASNRGTIFRIGRNGSNYSLIHEFLLNTNGSVPRDLIEATDGMLYGVTSAGGILNGGTVFRCSRDGSVFEVLHRFAGSTDGHSPGSALLEASDGYLYGATAGNPTNRGTLFRMRKDGSDYSVIWRFTAGPGDGSNPRTYLIEHDDGTLLGTTWLGGLGNGTIFRIGKDGSRYEQLWQFGAISLDGSKPLGGLARSSSGVYYGAAEAGGWNDAGALFRFDPQRVALTIAVDNSAAVLEWPVSSTIDQLEHSSSLFVPSWTPVPQPAVNLGGRYRATLPNPTDTQRFFHLRRAWP